MEDLIRMWLEENGGFKAGLELLKKIDRSTYKYQFKRWENRKLIPSDVAKALKKALVRFVAPERTQAAFKKNEIEEPEEPLEVKMLRKEGAEKYKVYSHLKGRLRLMVEDSKFSNADRYKVAKEIMEELIPEIDGIYDDIRVFTETGKLAFGARRVVRETVQKMKRIQSLRSQISYLNMKKKKQKGKGLKKIEVEIDERRLALEALENELNLS